MEEVEVEGTTGDQEEVLATREQTGLLWVELAIGCLVITLEGVTTEVGVLEAVSSVGREGTKHMTVQTKEEEVVVVVVVEASVEVDLAGVGVEVEVGDATAMLHLLNSRGTLCSKMGTSPLEGGMEVEVVEVNTREVVGEEGAGIKVMEVNMMGLEEVMEEEVEEVEMVSRV